MSANLFVPPVGGTLPELQVPYTVRSLEDLAALQSHLRASWTNKDLEGPLIVNTTPDVPRYRNEDVFICVKGRLYPWVVDDGDTGLDDEGFLTPELTVPAGQPVDYYARGSGRTSIWWPNQAQREAINNCSANSTALAGTTTRTLPGADGSTFVFYLNERSSVQDGPILLLEDEYSPPEDEGKIDLPDIPGTYYYHIGPALEDMQLFFNEHVDEEDESSDDE